MALEKRSIASMETEAEQLDKKIELAKQRLHTLQCSRNDLQRRIDNAKAFQIYGILQARNISIEDAAKILDAANPVIEDNENETDYS